MTNGRVFQIQQQIQLRFLCPDDIDEVKELCADWFPIKYPQTWYEDITSSKRFYSLAATYNSSIVGIIVCEVKTRSRCNVEDSEILASYYPADTQMAYILSLGVVKHFRRHGIASLLLDNLLSYLTSDELSRCKVVYLHVLASNQTAIRFYERRSFRPHICLPFYYSIKGRPCDGFSYVLYLNGGKPPSPLLLHHISQASSLALYRTGSFILGGVSYDVYSAVSRCQSSIRLRLSIVTGLGTADNYCSVSESDSSGVALSWIADF